MKINKRIVFLVAGVVVVTGLFIIGAQITKKSSSPSLGGEQAAPGSTAYLVYKDAAYLPFSVDANNLLKADVAYFAIKNFKAYNTTPQPTIIFNLSKQPTIKNNATIITGSFEKAKDKITISVTTLKNDRIKTSITDTATEANIDTLLPSNSARNQYIATLPQQAPAYTIDYLSNSDSFIITLYDTSARDTALRALQTGLKLGSLDSESYQVLTPSSTTDGSPSG